MRKLAIATGIAASTAVSAVLLALGGSSAASANPALEGVPLPVPGVQLPVPNLPVPIPDLPLPGAPTGA